MKTRRKEHAVDPKIARRAKALVDKYQVIVRFEDGEYFAHGLEYWHAGGFGPTPQAAIDECKAVMQTTVEADLEAGIPPCVPAGENRSMQINIRVSPEEKLRMEALANAKGFKGIADYVRSAALAS